MKKQKTHKESILPKRSHTHLFIIAAILVCTFFSYYPSFQNGFTNWDDTEYVTGNVFIQSAAHFPELFTKNFVGNYHPFTMISLFIDHSIAGLNPLIYILHNLLLHIFSTVLVFFLIVKLCGQLKQKTIYAIITAFLFGIHPIHVESVSWISERKDVLYVFYFLLSVLIYVHYVSTQNKKFYWLSIVIFICSLLSKGQAVALSLTVVAVDYFMGRDLRNKYVIIEKIPFFLLSVIFGVIAIHAQGDLLAPHQIAHYDIFKRMLFASYSFWQYIVSIFAPYDLSAFYPYPQQVSLIFWISPVIVAALLLLLFMFRKDRVVVFGAALFVSNIFFLLQLLPVGLAIMADRYNYIPSIGISLLLAHGFVILSGKYKNSRKLMSAILIVFGIVLCVTTNHRTKVWHDSISIWDDMLKGNTCVPFAWNNKGLALETNKDLAGAKNCYDNAITCKKDFYEAYGNRGHVLYLLKDFNAALADYDTAIKLQPDAFSLYFNKGLIKQEMKLYAEALRLFDKAISLNNTQADMYSSRGYVKQLLGKFQESIADFDESVKLNPKNYEDYANRGVSKLNLKNYYGAISDLSTAISMNSQYGIAYFMRGVAYSEMGNRSAGCNDFNTALQLGLPEAQDMMNKNCMQ